MHDLRLIVLTMSSKYKEIEDKEIRAKLLARQNPILSPELQVKYSPVGTCLPIEFAEIMDTIRDLELRAEDIFVCSLPRSGTTWCQEMVWLLNEDLDYERAKTLLNNRFPMLEFDGTPLKFISDPKIKQSSIETIINTNSPRYIKSHLNIELLPKAIHIVKPKIIYVVRNPRDQCVSLYHNKVLVQGYTGTLEDFVEEYLMDYWHFAPYWPHVREFWNRRNEPNILFLKYEDMVNDLPAVVRRTAKFLGKSPSKMEIEKLVHHISFHSMKNNPAVNNDESTELLTRLHGQGRKTHFIRKGQVGSGKEELSAESIQKIDDWISKNKIVGIWEYI